MPLDALLPVVDIVEEVEVALRIQLLVAHVALRDLAPVVPPVEAGLSKRLLQAVGMVERAPRILHLVVLVPAGLARVAPPRRLDQLLLLGELLAVQWQDPVGDLDLLALDGDELVLRVIDRGVMTLLELFGRLLLEHLLIVRFSLVLPV